MDPSSELNLDSALAAIERQWGRHTWSEEQRRENALVEERLRPFKASDPYPRQPGEPLIPQAGGDEEAWERFHRSPEGQKLERRRQRWRGRAGRRHEAARREVRELLRRRDVLERRQARRPPAPPRLVRPLLLVARPRERRPARRRVVATRGSPSRSDPDLADPPDFVGVLLALARATR